MTALAVSVGGVGVGLLQQSGEGSFFELDEEYLSLPNRPVLGQRFEDNPTQPHRTRQGVPSWFANLLPEGPLRRLIAERAGVNERRSLFLLRLLGDDLPGAVVIRPLGVNGGDEDVRAPTGSSELPLRFSLAGVQMKFSAIREGRGMTIPVQGLGGDWIVKLPAERFEGVPENEFLMMQLAQGAGLSVPETRLVSLDQISGLPEQVAASTGRALAVRRFDRADDGTRVHIEDFAQVLGLSPAEKYGTTNYDTMARVIVAVCGDDDTDEFLRRLVFMVAIGNSDAHTKNWSLIYPDGRSARLAPAYDLVAVSLYETIDRRLNRQMALRLGGTNDSEAVSEATFRRLAERAELDEERTSLIVRDQAQAIHASWADLKKSQASILETQLVQLLDERFARLPLLS